MGNKSIKEMEIDEANYTEEDIRIEKEKREQDLLDHYDILKHASSKALETYK